MNRAEAEALFLRELPLIDRIIAAACRRGGFVAADAEDVAAALRLKLIENDYRAIRDFESRSAFATYVTVMVQRFLIDERNHRWGRWRPSAEAVRLGAKAVRLETLLHRDDRTFDEAAALMAREASRGELEALAARFPRRMPRTTMSSIEETQAAQFVPSADSPDRRFFAAERERLGVVASAVLDAAIAALPAEDRLLLKMRFDDEMSVADIARATGQEQRRLYYRIDRLALEMRRALEEAGVDRAAVRDLLASGAATFALRNLGISAPQRSKEEGAVSREAPAE